VRWKNGWVSNLVDRRGDLVVLDQVDQAVRVEVRHADRPDPAVGEQALHGPPGAVDVADRLVDEVQVEVVEAEALQRCVEGFLRGLFAGVLDPQFGRDEQFVAQDATLGDRAADLLLVEVGGGGVEQPVASRECVGDGLLGLLGRDLVDAEADDRHLDAVVQGDLRRFR
jgi:hypothetical protein